MFSPIFFCRFQNDILQLPVFVLLGCPMTKTHNIGFNLVIGTAENPKDKVSNQLTKSPPMPSVYRERHNNYLLLEKCKYTHIYFIHPTCSFISIDW